MHRHARGTTQIGTGYHMMVYGKCYSEFIQVPSHCEMVRAAPSVHTMQWRSELFCRAPLLLLCLCFVIRKWRTFGDSSRFFKMFKKEILYHTLPILLGMPVCHARSTVLYRSSL